MFPENMLTTSGFIDLLHVVISLPDAYHMIRWLTCMLTFWLCLQHASLWPVRMHFLSLCILKRFFIEASPLHIT